MRGWPIRERSSKRRTDDEGGKPAGPTTALGGALALEPLLALAADRDLGHGHEPGGLDRLPALLADTVLALGQPLQRPGETIDAGREALPLGEGHVLPLAGLGDVTGLEGALATVEAVLALRQAQAGQRFDGGGTLGQHSLADAVGREPAGARPSCLPCLRHARSGSEARARDLTGRRRATATILRSGRQQLQQGLEVPGVGAQGADAVAPEEIDDGLVDRRGHAGLLALAHHV